MAAGARGRRHQPKRVACPKDLQRMARVDGTVTAHRLAAARMIGRPLWPWEVVHHRNHDQDDNSHENLEIFPSNVAHKLAEHGKLLLGCYNTLTSPEESMEPKINPQLESLLRPINELKPHPRNPMQHDEDQLTRLEAIFKRYGIQLPIVALEDGTIIAGHARVEVCKRLAWPAIPTITFATEDEATEWVQDADAVAAMAEGFMVADNQVSRLGKWRNELLQEIVHAQEALGVNIAEALAFTADDLAKRFKEVPTERVADSEIPDKPKKPTTKIGDLWRLGEHLILCADSTLKKNVGQLFDDQVAQAIITDPPYGISYTDQGGKHEAIAGDELRGDDLKAMVQKALKWANRYAAPDASYYIWHSPSTRADFTAALEAAGLQERQYLVWVKDTFTLGGADYQHGYEPIFYASRAGEKPAFYGNRAQSTIWRIAYHTGEGDLAVAMENGLKISTGDGVGIFIRPNAPKSHKIRLVRLEEGQAILLAHPGSDTDAWQVKRDAGSTYQHPTQKPITLAERALLNSTQADDIVYDAFGGAGFTLLAAERNGRRARICEIDPGYVDVMVDRWEAETSGKAKRAK